MLVKCPECGKEVSDKSKSCINCGYPIFDELRKSVLDSSKKEKSTDLNDDESEKNSDSNKAETPKKEEINYKETVQNGRLYHYVNSLNEKLCPYCHARISSEFSSSCSNCGKSIMVNTSDTHTYMPAMQPIFLAQVEKNENTERKEYYVRKSENDGKAIASLILGICAFLFGAISFVGLLCAIIGYILGKDYTKGIGNIGRIICKIAIIIFIIVLIIEICFFGSFMGVLGKFI